MFILYKNIYNNWITDYDIIINTYFKSWNERNLQS